MSNKNNFKVRDLVGKKVVLKIPVHTQNGMTLPAGLVLNANGFGNALHLSTDPCLTCGVSIHLRNVPKRYFTPLDESKSNAAYPAIAVWKAAETGFVECSRCKQRAHVGSDPVTCACGLNAGELYWKHCPKCGAGMALPEQLSNQDNEQDAIRQSPAVMASTGTVLHMHISHISNLTIQEIAANPAYFHAMPVEPTDACRELYENQDLCDGWLVKVPETIGHMPLDLTQCLQFADRMCADYILFQHGAPKYSDLDMPGD